VKEFSNNDNEAVSGIRTFYTAKRGNRRLLSLTMRMAHAINPLTTSSWNGKTNKFTNSFHNLMFEDTGINSIKHRRKIERIRKVNLAIKEKQKMYMSFLHFRMSFNEMKKKNMIAKFFESKFDVHAKYKDLRKFGQEKLEKILLIKGLKKKKIRAALKIQTFFKAFKAKKHYREMLEERERAAIRIQNVWKRYRMLTMIPKVMKERK
jgi:hypothetical protein